jgi:glycosyltransferase involved in cell wall biosynthesis
MYFAQEFEQEINKIFVMYLETDKKIYYPMNIAKPSRWKDKYVVFYFGSMNPLQGINVILEAVERLKEEKGISFIIVGPIDKKIKKYTGETVRYIDWLTQKEIAKYIAISDLCLSGHFSADIEKANRTIPGKAYIYDAMGKSMILGDSEANREYFEENEKHKFVELGNPQALSELILKMYYEWIKTN